MSDLKPTPDYVGDSLAAKARACLEHVRRIRWGTGNASYEVDDGDLHVTVDITVRGTREAAKKEP